MPWTTKNPPNVAKNWTDAEKAKCVKAANAVLADGGKDDEAIFACIHAAGKSKKRSLPMDAEQLRKLVNVGVTEYRFTEDMELRLDSGDGKKIVGYASMFDVRSQPIMGMFIEIVKRGAFKKTLKEADVRALMNHDPSMVLGRKSANTLRLKEDDKGLRYEIDPPDTSYANDLMKSIERGDVRESSFGFMTVRDKWYSDGDVQVRELLEVKLFDVSPVTFPAYEQTEVQVRSILDSFGIKADRIAAALFKARAGLELQEEEIRAIAGALDVLKVCDVAEPPEHSADPQKPDATRAHLLPEGFADPKAAERRLVLALVNV